MKKLLKIFIPATILLTSCSSISKMTSEKNVSTDPLHRSEYTISEDKTAEGSVTQTFGLFYNNKVAKRKGRMVKMDTDKLMIGNFYLNVKGALIGTLLSAGLGYAFNNFDFASGSLRNHDEMVKRGSDAVYMPTGVAIGLGITMGLGLNAFLLPAPNHQAENIAKYNFITENNFDYIINPRLELVKNNSFFRKTSNVKITAKGMNINTDKK